MFYGNGFVRCEVKFSSGCRVPHVTGVRYRSNSVSRRDYMIGGGHFPINGICLFFCYLSMVNTGWHHENIVPDILKDKSECPGFFTFLESFKRKKMLKEDLYETNLSGL